MKPILSFLIILCIQFAASSSAAQYYFYDDKHYSGRLVIEAGSSAGLMNSLTDLGGRKGRGKKFIKDLNWRVTKPSYSLYLLALYKDAIALRLEGTVGHIASYDSLLKNTDPDLGERYGRNLGFRSPVADGQLGIEIHPLFFHRYDDNAAPYWSPYLVTGIGYYTFNPQAKWHGNWYALHPLRLEGQGFAEYPGHKPYRLRQFNIPAGIGVRYETGPFFQVRLEIIHRILFTDYLDDVSNGYIDAGLFSHYLLPAPAFIASQLYSRMQELQPGYRVKEGMARGDHRDKDAFFSIQLKAGWVFRKGK